MSMDGEREKTNSLKSKLNKSSKNKTREAFALYQSKIKLCYQ